MTNAPPHQPIPCPFVYANGRACVGHVVRVEAYKADITWYLDAKGYWDLNSGRDRTIMSFAPKRATTRASAARIPPT